MTRNAKSFPKAILLGTGALLAALAAAADPAIFSFSPASGMAGDIVVISGTNFGPTAADDVVRFGALPATVLAASSNSLTVVVPARAACGPLTVTANDATAYAKTFFPVTFPNAASWVTAWGDNTYGQTNVPPGLTNAIAVAAGACSFHNLALKSDGTVVAWGENNDGQANVPAGLSNVVAITAGGYHNLALKNDGSVVAWGFNSNWNSYTGQAVVPADLTNVAAVAAGWYHSLVLKADGTVTAWGYNGNGQTNVPADLSNVVAIAGAPSYNLALKVDGTVATWGTNYLSANGTNYPLSMAAPPGLTNAIAIAAGYFHCLALKADGTVVAWGDNSYGQTNVPAGLSNVVAIAAGSYNNVALKADGSMVGWGFFIPDLPPGNVTNVVAVGAGYFHSVALVNSSLFNTPVISAPPVIVSFSPASGTNGTVVTIAGTNFSANAGSNIVYFGAVRANVLSASANSLTVSVPSGATFAPITVTVNGLVAYSAAPFEPTFAGNGAAINAATFAPSVNLNVASPITSVIADLDGDGKPDVVAANVYANSITILQNIGSPGALGAASFAPPVVLPIGSGSEDPVGVVAADLDGDGKLDLVVADNSNNQIAVFRNVSSGGLLTSNSFAPPVFFSVAGNPRRLVVCDLDGDGHPDLVTVNTGNGTVSILHNLGLAGAITTNSFAAPVNLALAGTSESVAVGDLDGDGKPDLAVADSSGFISLFRTRCTPGNISTSTFDARVDLPAQSGSLNVVIGDLDGDGKPELITSAYLPQTMSVYVNQATPGALTTNSFAAPVDYALAGRGHTIALSDMNGDGKPDVLEVTELASALSLFQNVGTGSFTNTSLAARVDFATGWNAWGVAVGDLDADGRPDVVFGNVYDNTLTIYKNQTGLPTNPPAANPPLIVNVSPNSGAAGSPVTIWGANFSPVAASNIVYFGAVQANVLSASSNSLTLTVPAGAIYAPVTVTVNGLTAWANAPFLPTFNGGTNGLALAPRLDLPAGDGAGQAIFADVDGDGKPDLLVNSGSPQFISIYRNISTNGAPLGAASFAPRVDVPLPGSIQNGVLADVDGDGKLDFVVLDRAAGQVHILKNVSTPGNITSNAFVAVLNLPTGNDPRGLVVRDLDGDGLPDIAVANWADGTVSVFRNLGTASGITTNSFAAPVVFAVGANPQDLKAADLDGDGKPDLVTANNNYGTTNSVSLLRNTSSPGTISFAPQVALAGLPTCYWLAIGDLDGDGKPDIAVSSFDQGQSVSVYRNTSSPGNLTASSFAPNVDFAAGGWGNAVAIADLDGDGKPDLAVLTQLPDHLSVFKNVSTPGSFTTNSLAPRVDYPTGWNPNGIAIGDLDGDGRPDIAFAVTYGATLSLYQNLTGPATNPPPVSPPVITSINPAIAVPGTTVTISGSNFNASADATFVYFGAVRAKILSTSPNGLMVTVPAGATFGPVTVSANGLTAYSGQLFEPTFSGGGTNITTGNFAPSFTLGTGGNPQSCIIADLDGDGKPDVALVSSDGHCVSIFRNISTNGALLDPNSFAPRVDLAFPTNGTGGNAYRVRAVDLDGDGRLDLIACEINGNRVSVFHNISTPGSLTTNSFEPAFALIAGNDCRFATAGDLDGDGRVDIVALNYGDKTISLFKNISVPGALTVHSFAPPVVLAAPGGPYDAVIADLNGDGQPDLAVANSDSGTVSVYQNAGTPGVIATNSFLPGFDLAAGVESDTVAAVDLDGDGQLDLVVGSVQSDYVSVFRNAGGGGLLTTNSFPARVDFGTPGWMHIVSVADFNGDGKPDLAAVGELPSYMSIFQNVSTPGSFTSASFAPRVDFGTGWNAWGVATGDLDGDGRPDIVFCNQYDGNIQIYQNLAPFAAPPATNPPVITSINPAVATPGTTVTIAGSNFNATAASDIVYFGAVKASVSSASPTSLTVAVPAGATFGPITVTAGGLTAYSGQLFAPTFSGSGTNITAGGFAPSFTLPASGPGSCVIADLDGDGKPDLAFVDASSQSVTVYRNVSTNSALLGAPSFAPRIDLPFPPGTGTNAYRLRAADLDGDGRLDLIACEVDGSNVTVFHNVALPGSLATNSFEPAFDLPAGNDCRFATAADLDGDGRVDIVALNYGDQTISILRNIGTPGTLNAGSFAPQVVLACPGGPYEAVIADLDGDGKPDLAVVNQDNFTLSIFQNAATPGSLNANSFAPRLDLPAEDGNDTIAAVDLDGDGKLDLVFGSYRTETISVYRNASTGGLLTTNSFAPRVDFGTGDWTHTLAIADFNGDGKPDIAVVGELPSTLSIFQNVSTPGSFTSASLAPRVDFSTGWNAWGVAAGDLDGDGRPDIVFCNYYDNNVQIYQNVMPLGGLPAAPAILAQTPDQVVLLGNPATFSVTAGGSEPLSFFWSRNGTLIPDATNASYTLSDAQLADSGSQFSCLVTNLYGSAASTNVSLKVIDTISNDLCSGAVVIAGYPYTNAQSTFNASSYGDPVPDCIGGFGNGVWYQFTPAVAGQLVVDTFGSDFDTGLAVYTGDCDGLTEVACNDDTGGVTSQVILPAAAGVTYRILAGGYGAHVGNLVLHLNFLTAPAFTAQPENQTVVAGNTASFSATLTGALPMGLQWYFNGAPLTDDGRISGSLTANLIISNVTTADAGGYTLTATNYLGSTNSTTAVLTVPTPPVFTSQPVGRSVPPGLPTIFSAAAFGNPAPSYQWQLNGTNLPGWLPAGNYTIPAVATNNLGFYSVVASNSVGSVTSAVAQLTFGPVAAWGRNISNESLPPPGLSNVVGIAGGYYNGFAVRTDGRLTAWGGVGTNVPASATNVVAVSVAGAAGTYALRADGTVVGWNGPAMPGTISNIVAVAAGNQFFGMALRAEGTVVGWGNVPYSLVPAGLNHVTAIACGNTHSLALRSDGVVVAWGTGPGTNVPASLTNVTAIAAGYSHSLALKADGTVVAWGSGSGTNLPPGLTNIVAISSENIQSSSLDLALRADGTVVAWGDNPYGETNPPAALTNLLSVAIAAAPYHGLALVNDGSPQMLHPPVGLTAYTGRDVTLRATVVGAAPLSYQWLLNGTNIFGATNTTLFIPNVQLANAGNYQLFVSNSVNTAISLPAPVKVVSSPVLTFLSQSSVSSSNVYQGGTVSFYGGAVLGNGPLHYQWFWSPTNRNYTAVSGATNDALALDPALAWQSGNYYLAASNGFIQLNQTYTVTSAPVNVRILFARAWGFNAVSNPPVNVTNAVAVATGGAQGNSYGHYLALGADGKVTAWANYFAYNGETNVAALSNSFVTAIAAGYENSLALKSDGTVYAWGYNAYGQTNVPPGLNHVVAIACGGYHDLALKADGTVVGWGASSQINYGQATNNPAATNVVAIAAGLRHSLALRADGSVVAWGYSGDGATFVPYPATNVVAIAAGSGFSEALRADGTVVQWGSGLANYPVPRNLSNVVAIAASGTHCTALKNDGSVVSWGYEYIGTASNNVPRDLANVAAISSGGDHDIGLFGTRAPIFTVQPWDRAVSILPQQGVNASITLAAKCVGVQPVYYQWRLNGTNIPSATNDTWTLGSLSGALPPRPIPPGAYQLVASNAYGVTYSQPAKVSLVIPLGYALNAPNLNWTTTGDAQWYGQTNITHDGQAAARSGGIGGSQETILQTTLATNSAGTVSFWWKVSSEPFFDTLEFLVNGAVQTNISGEVDWQLASFPLPAGTNVLQWRYAKDPTFDAGLDAGFVDQFSFASAPMILRQPANVTANYGATINLAVLATGSPTPGYQWQQNGVPVGGNSPSLTLNNACRAQDGVYSVTVTNAGGAVVSSNAVVHVNVPQLLGTPKLLPDGSLQLTSTDVNGGGTLSPSDLPNFEAQASTDLVNWVTLPNALSLTNGTLQLSDSSRTNYAARYYRIIEH